jgi:hypothetical protein
MPALSLSLSQKLKWVVDTKDTKIILLGFMKLICSLSISRSQHEKYASTVMGLPAVARTYFARGRKRRWEEKAAILLLIIIVTTAVSSSCTFLKCCYSAAASTGEETRRRRRIMTETVVIKRRNNNTNDSCRHRNK